MMSSSGEGDGGSGEHNGSEKCHKTNETEGGEDRRAQLWNAQIQAAEIGLGR